MQVFVYEFVTGGGMRSAGGGPPAGSLWIEGQAMATAITADFCAIPGVEVVTTRDSRLAPFHPPACKVRVLNEPEDLQQVVAKMAAAADWSLVIAPETSGQLHALVALVAEAGGRLLSPAAAVVELTSNKQRTADHLAAYGVPSPAGVILDDRFAPSPDMFPAVVKPNDGCGSQGVAHVATPAALAAWLDENERHGPVRLERFISGLAASVALLCGPKQRLPLPASQQWLSQDGRFAYRGGRLPLPPHLNVRAQRLALAAIATLPQPVGYLGVDLVLGEAADVHGDYVIEINPRLTTSYVGLRALCHNNLAAAMLAVARGELPALSWRDEPLEFTANGDVFHVSSAIPDGCTP